MSGKIKAVIFDLDGVLLECVERCYRAFEDTLSFFGQSKIGKKEWLKATKSDGINDLLFKKEKGCKEKIFLFWKRFLANYRNYTQYSEPISGASAILRSLKEKGYLIGIVTSRVSSVKEVEEELKYFGILEAIDTVVTKKEVLEKSSMADILAREGEIKFILEKFNLNPKECLFVCDTRKDIKAAKKLGMKVIAVLSGLSAREALEIENPDLIVKDVNELIKFI